MCGVVLLIFALYLTSIKFLLREVTINSFFASVSPDLGPNS